MRVLITGSNGQLGSEIRELAANYKKLDLFLKIFLGWIFVILIYYNHLS